MLIRDYHKEDRPRERFIQDGPQSLIESRTASFIIKNGNKGRISDSISQSCHSEF